MLFIGYKFLPEKDNASISTEDVAKYERELDYSAIPRSKRIIAVTVLVLTVLGMVFIDRLGIEFYVIGWIGALILVYTKVINSQEAIASMDCPVSY